MLRKKNIIFRLIALTALLSGSAKAEHSVARQWNEENLAAIRIDVPHPPVHARNLFHAAVAMYDAWAAYDPVAVGYIHHERLTAADIDLARREAVSYAAYRVLKARYAGSANASVTQSALDSRMAALGYDTAATSTAGGTPMALGNRIAASILTWGLSDGSGETGGYTDGSYVNDQPEFTVLDNGVPLGGYPAGADPDRWHPLTFDEGFAQNGVGPVFLQPFLGETWIHTRPFSLRRTDASGPWFDPGPPPRLRDEATAEAYRAEVIELLAKSRQLGELTLSDISPASLGNHPLGTESGGGHVLNPQTGLPYAENKVPLGDYGRVLAEFWADGPDSETPPGHWHSIANEVTDKLTEKRIGGTGAIVSDLEWDVKLYFALAAATHDAACAAWSLKIKYDSPRPISMIRGMSLNGQSEDPLLPNYHEEGMPLVTGLVEVVTSDSLLAGGKHEGSGFSVGDIVVFTWPGRPVDPTTQRSLPRWIRGIDWFPFQNRTFVSPAFPGYISGHSCFSRAAAEVLTAITGSGYFPGGMGGFTAEEGNFLKFESGPSVTVSLQWATYFDAADEAGASRRWGGIHPVSDDLPGRVIGSECGRRVWSIVPAYWDGSIVNQEFLPDVRKETPETATLRWDAVPGLWYRVFRTVDFSEWNAVTVPLQATEPQMEWTDVNASQPRFFYRISQSATQPEI